MQNKRKLVDKKFNKIDQSFDELMKDYVYNESEEVTLVSPIKCNKKEVRADVKVNDKDWTVLKSYANVRKEKNIFKMNVIIGSGNKTFVW